jgi:predicted acylesterase/phospholipase RssA
VVGEAEVLTGEARSGTLVARRDSEIISVPKESILALARERPEVLLRLNRALANRLRGQNSDLARRHARTFAVVPAHPGAPVTAVAKALVEALKPLGTVVHVDRRSLDSHIPEGPGTDLEAYEAEIIAWLSEKETENDYVVAEAESDPATEWSLRCLRQGDRDVFVARADSAPDAAIFGRLAEQTPEPPDLVLVHAADALRPRHTRNWLKAGSVNDAYHWPLGHAEQAAHIARRLTGNAVAVVFSGGAARGYAHIGAMRAIIERGIPVDVIAGTSMGALVGAGFALGRDAATMKENALATAGRRQLLDPTLPFTAFTSGAKVTRLLKRETDGERIEDLWRPYFCISSNLTRANAQIHTKGALWHAIRASIAIPGIFPPVLAANGDVLVDGSSINNMPIDLAREREDVGTVIAINVAPSRDRVEQYRFGPSISGWKTLAMRIRRSKDSRVPGLFSTVMRSNEIRGAALMKSSSITNLADLIIEPPVEEFPSLQFKLCPAIIRCGYDAASEALDSWLAADGKLIMKRIGSGGE